jgi:hypothetical protein
MAMAIGIRIDGNGEEEKLGHMCHHARAFDNLQFVNLAF